MRSLLMCLALVIGSAVYAQSVEIPLDKPDRWSITVTRSAKRDFEYVVKVTHARPGDNEVVILTGEINAPTSSYKRLFVGKIEDKEVDSIWSACKTAFVNFTFENKHPDRMDGGYLKVELQGNSQRIQASYFGLSDNSEVSPQIGEILKEIDERYMPKPAGKQGSATGRSH